MKINTNIVLGFINNEEYKFKKVIGKSGKVWLIPNNSHPADNVYVDYDNSGYGGRTIPFELEDGSKLELTGPRKSNADSLYEDTGIDIRNKYLTHVVIAEKGDSFRNEVENVFYNDIEPYIGSFDRGNKLAQEIANGLKKKVYYSIQTSGGGSSGYCHPKEEL